jgi:2-aminoadipate transaminase
MNIEMKIASRMSRVQPNAVGELLRMGADPSIISFAGGYPDATLFPREALNAVYQRAILENGQQSLQYTVSDGPLKLRRQIADRMTKRGTPAEADQILVLQGSQQGLDLVSKLLVDPGDTIITESPTFLGALIAFNPVEPRYLGVKMDEQGLDPDHLQTLLAANRSVKFIYTIPDFQNPTGVSLSHERRKRVIELANEYDIFILEDTAYREVRFQGTAPPTLKSLDTEGRVILLGSFSKILAPGLRLGWVMASNDIIQKLGLLKLAADTQCSTLNMAAVSLFLETYDLDAHIVTLQNAYRRKKNLMLDAMRQHFPQDISTTDPDGGLFTWATFPKSFDSEDFMRSHALPLAKVAYVPGASFFPEALENNHARFNYSGQSDERIIEGVASLGRALKQHRKHAG